MRKVGRIRGLSRPPEKVVQTASMQLVQSVCQELKGSQCVRRDSDAGWIGRACLPSQGLRRSTQSCRPLEAPGQGLRSLLPGVTSSASYGGASGTPSSSLQGSQPDVGVCLAAVSDGCTCRVQMLGGEQKGGGEARGTIRRGVMERKWVNPGNESQPDSFLSMESLAMRSP